MSALVANQHTPVDASGGPVSMTLPASANNGDEVSVEKYDITSNAVTVTGNMRGTAGASTKLSLPREAITFRARVDSGVTSWWPVSGHKTLSSMDGRYAGRAIPTATNAWAQSAQNSNISATSGTSRTYHQVAVDCGDVVLEYDNVLIAIVSGLLVDQAGANTVSVRASVETPDGTIYRATFNGAVTGSIDPGGFLRSDPVPIDLQAGTKIWVRTWVSAAAAPKSNTASFKSTGTGGFSTSDLTAPGSGAVADGVAFQFGPKAVTATPKSAAAKALLVVGDSIAAGYGDTNSGSLSGGQYAQFNESGNSGGGYITRGLGSSIGWINVAVSGDKGSTFLTNSASFGRMRYAARCTHAVVEYGNNDVFTGATAATVQATLQGIWARLAGRGLRIVATTITPRTNSTDSWATAANQTPVSPDMEANRVAVNTWLRTLPSPLIALWDAADLAETARNSGIWRPNYTTEGVHPNPTATAAMAACIDLTKLT